MLFYFLGVTNDSGKTGIDAMNPTDDTEFDEFGAALKNKIIQYEVIHVYMNFFLTS